MLGCHKAHVPWVFFVAVGALWTLLCFSAGPLYDWGTGILRRLGCTRVANWRQRLRPRVILPVRVAFLIAAVLSYVFAIVAIAE